MFLKGDIGLRNSADTLIAVIKTLLKPAKCINKAKNHAVVSVVLLVSRVTMQSVDVVSQRV